MKSLPLSSQSEVFETCLADLNTIGSPEEAESILARTFGSAPEHIVPDSEAYTDVLNCHLYWYILKHYKQGAERICLWRFIKNLPHGQLHYENETAPDLKMLDALMRMYLYSDPLEDLTCLFIPISAPALIRQYLAWIKGYFYNADYPTSLLWLYALDSSLASLFPDEIVFLGRCAEENHDRHILRPDFTHTDTVLLKRYSEEPAHFAHLEGKAANDEFRQIFAFLEREHKDRCLSRSGRQDEYVDQTAYKQEWEKFEDVLKFGVSDRHEKGCVSFSDMRASTEFLNTYGKSIYLNKVQQPFFEQTKLISKKYGGRIDKFMGDNVMCVFLGPCDRGCPVAAEDEAVLNNFFAIFDLCKILYALILKEDLEASRLGLRSGVTYGEQILRSNLGNEFVRDFTVTGETVNLAARLEHISIHELKLHNEMYFQDAIERFPKISQLVSVCGDRQALNTETRAVIQNFTLYQNICSNLEKLNHARFDIRFNQAFYFRIRAHLARKGYAVVNANTADVHGYEEYTVDGLCLRFYFVYYNPKGFAGFERTWILPLEPDMLRGLDIRKFR